MEENLKTYLSKFTALKYRFRSNLFRAEEELFRKIAHRDSLRVLDLGVGAGRTSRHFHGFPDYIGIDYSSVMVDLCRKKFKDLQGQRFKVGDARSILFSDSAFDLVIFSFNGIDYVSSEDRSKVLSEIKRVLAPNGMFFFSTHNIRSLNPSLRRGRSVIRRMSDHWRSFLIRRLNPGLDLAECATQGRAVLRDMPTLRTHYISLEEQRIELTRAGFSIHHALDEDGMELGLGGWEREPHGKWFYIIAGKGHL